MDMPEYLHAIEHAASETLRLVWSEHQLLEELQAKIAALAAEIEDTNSRIDWLRENPAFDDDLQATAMHWESYFGPEKEQFHAEKRKPDLESLIDTRKFSTDAQSGSVLQYAKQGISLVHHGLTACPDGRLIGTQPIKNVVWQGRNQAMHWDEGKFNQAVRDCFEALVKDVDPAFCAFTRCSMAWEIVRLLEWRKFDDFRKDMLSLS
jgi:hypothetical protein